MGGIFEGGNSSHETSDLRLRRVAVDWQPAPSLPDLVGDPQQTGQVVLNLLNNAEQVRRSREVSTSAGSVTRT